MAGRKESSNVVLSIRSWPGTGLSFYLLAVPRRNCRAFEIIAVALSDLIEEAVVANQKELHIHNGRSKTFQEWLLFNQTLLER